MNKMKWTTEKPLADKEKVFVSAYKYKDEWNYTLWEIRKVDGMNEAGEDCWYYGLCDADGEEWGPYEDLDSEIYLEIPSADAVVTVQASVASKA